MNQEMERILLRIAFSPCLLSGDLRTASTLIVDAVRDGLAVGRASLWLRHGDETFRCERLSCDGRTGVEPPPITTPTHPNFVATLNQQRHLMADDAQQHPQLDELIADYLRPLAIAAQLIVPLHHQQRLIGFLSCEQVVTPRHWQNGELQFVTKLAELYDRAVTSSERLGELQQLAETNTRLEARLNERVARHEAAVAELKRLQQQLIDSEKMAALGTLVAGVAHEVNTPLGVAVTAVSHCHEEIDLLVRLHQQQQLTEREFSRRLQTMVEGVQLVETNLGRAAQLVSDFKRTAADQASGNRGSFLLDDYLKSLANSLGPLFRQRGVVFSLAVPPGIRCDSYPGALAQVVTNLATNAVRYAFGEGFEGEPRLTMNAAVIDNDLYLQVSDNGLGMAEPIRSRVFEPFFTTGRASGGTGLGLAIVHNLVTRTLGGTITLHSAPNAGSHFEIRIPCLAPQTSEAESS